MYNAVGAHIYAGGFSVGVRQHFNVLAHLEHNGYGADVVKLNWPDMPIYAGGVDSWPTSYTRPRPRFMFANPPCAIWSTASHGRAGHWSDDPRMQAHKEIFRYGMDVVAPDVFAIESVPPSFVKGRSYIDHLMLEAEKSGYSSTVVMHNAKWLGVPQNRSRIFYVFHKVAIPWDHPEYTTPITVRQAIKGLKLSKTGYSTEMPPRYAHWVSKAEPGEGLQHVFDRENPNPVRGDRGQIIGRPAFLDHRSPWDKPAGVVIGGKPIHPVETRWLAQEEVGALCGFPKDFKWPVGGSFNDITGYMSRGIMPPVGAWLAGNVAAALDKNKRLNATTAQVLDVRTPPGRYYTL